jgi:hypothetical protein
MNASVQQGALQGVTHTKRVTADDLTNTGVASLQTISLFEIPKDGVVRECGFYSKTAFDGASSSELAVIVGDATDDDGFIASTTIHVDGTEVSSAINSGAYYTVGSDANTANGKVYDAAATGTISAIFTPTGDSLSDIDTGEIVFWANIVDFADVK